MRRLLAGVVAGLVLGLTVGLLTTAEAASWQKRIERRVSAVERKVTDLTNWAYSVNSAIDSIYNRLRSVESKTRQLDAFGNYTGEVPGQNIDNPIICSWGDPAVWDIDGLAC